MAYTIDWLSLPVERAVTLLILAYQLASTDWLGCLVG